MLRSGMGIRKYFEIFPCVSSLAINDLFFFVSINRGIKEFQFTKLVIPEISDTDDGQNLLPHLHDSELWGEPILCCLIMLNCLQFGRDDSRGNPLSIFQWPRLTQITSNSPREQRMRAQVLKALGPRSAHLDMHCPNLQDIHLLYIFLDEKTLSNLRACLEIRKGGGTGNRQTRKLLRCVVTTRGCAFDKGSFPDVTEFGFEELEGVLKCLYGSRGVIGVTPEVS